MNKKSSHKMLTVLLSIIILVVAIIPSFAAGTTVGTETDLRAAIDASASGDTITLSADIELTAFLEITGKTITIDGNGKTITAAGGFATSATETLKNNLVTVANGADVTFENITLKTKEMNRHTLNVYSAKAGLKDVTLDHAVAETGAPLILGTGIADVTGTFNVIAGPNSWYGINVDNHLGANDGDAALNIPADAVVSFVAPGAQRFICVEQKAGNKAATVVAPSLVANAVKDEAGNVKTYYGTTAAINVVDEATLREAIADAVEGSVITLKDNIALSAYLNIAGMKPTAFTIDGAGFAITAAANFAGTTGDNTTLNLVQLDNSDVAFKNISIITSAVNRHALNVYQSNTTLTNVKLDHTNSFAGAPLIANSSTVTIAGTFEPVLGVNSWYAVNLDNKYDLPTSITFEAGASVVFTDAKRAFIFSETLEDGTTEIIGMDAVVADLGLVEDTDTAGNKFYRLAKNIISLAIDKTDINALADKDDSFIATVTLDATSNEVTLDDFSITNSAGAIATVDGGTAVTKDGVLTITFKVKTLAVGKATITIALKENAEKNATININVLNKADYTELDVQLADYNAKVATKDNYTPETWAAVVAEVAKANALDRNTLTTLTNADVKAVADSLKTALSKLVLKKADLTNLNAQIAAFDALKEEQYTPATWAVAKAAYNTAKAFGADTTIDKQDAVNAAQTALVKAIEDLVYKDANADDLNTAIAAADKAIATTGVYSKKSLAELQVRVDEAKALIASNPTILDQEKVDEKLAEIDAFVEKLVVLDYAAAVEAKEAAEVKAEDYKQDENWTAFSAAVKELEALLKNNEVEEQEEIDAAVKKVVDAQALLVKVEVETTTTIVETTTSKSDEKPAPVTGDAGLSVALTALGLGGLALVLSRKREEKEEA